MDANMQVNDARGKALQVGDEVATAMVSRRAGAGLMLGTVVSLHPSTQWSVEVQSRSTGRTLMRAPDEVVKVAP